MNLDTIAENRLLWGNNAHGYYEKAEAGMDRQWENTISPFINQVKIDYSNTLNYHVFFIWNKVELKF